MAETSHNCFSCLFCVCISEHLWQPTTTDLSIAKIFTAGHDVAILVFNRCGLHVTHCYVGVTIDFVINPADVVKHHCGRWMITLGFITQICFSHLIFPVSDSTQVGCCITLHLDSCLCVEVHLNNQEFNHCQFLGVFAKL